MQARLRHIADVLGLAAAACPSAPRPRPPSTTVEIATTTSSPSADPSDRVALPASETRVEAPEPALPSCENVQLEYLQSLDIDAGVSITAGAFGAVLNRGDWFRHCDVPLTTTLRVCAAVQHGRAVGITVTTEPSDPAVVECVVRAVAGLSFPSKPELDVTRTTFVGG